MTEPQRLSIGEVAERVGLPTATIWSYVSRSKFPPPDGHMGHAAWWKLSTVQQWERTRRKPGRPKG